MTNASLRYLHGPLLVIVISMLCNTVLVVEATPSFIGLSSGRRASLSKMQEKSDAVLKFSASYSYTSSPIYLQRQNSTLASSTLHDFFRSEEHRNCLLVGSGNMKVRKPNKRTNVGRSVFKSRWSEETSYFQSYGIESSDKNEDVEFLEILIKTPFLVFLINASALFGVRLTRDGEKEEIFTEGKIHSPEYQFVLLAEDFQAAGGPLPLVWIFNQLTGKGDQKMLSPKILLNEPHKIHTYLRVWASDSKSVKGDIKADRIVFKAKCKAQISFEFPSILLQILPAAKEIIEKQGNNALVESMERDVVPGVNEFREAFIKWQRKH